MGSSDELFAAIEAGDAEAVRAMVTVDPSLAAARDAEGVSALMRARYRSDAGMTDAILAAAPDVDVFDAAALGDRDRLDAILESDPSAATAFSGDGFTALHLAAFFGKQEAAELLLSRDAEVDARGRGWMTGTALHSATSADHTHVAMVLLDGGADPNARQSGGWTPLHGAAMNGNLELVEQLLAHGADPTVENDQGASALTVAREIGASNIVERIRASSPG